MFFQLFDYLKFLVPIAGWPYSIQRVNLIQRKTITLGLFDRNDLIERKRNIASNKWWCSAFATLIRWLSIKPYRGYAGNYSSKENSNKSRRTRNNSLDEFCKDENGFEPSNRCHATAAKVREPNPRNRFFTPRTNRVFHASDHGNKTNKNSTPSAAREDSGRSGRTKREGARGMRVISVEIAKLRHHCAVIARSELSRSFFDVYDAVWFTIYLCQGTRLRDNNNNTNS